MKKFPEPIDFIGYALGIGFILLCLTAIIVAIGAVTICLEGGCYCG